MLVTALMCLFEGTETSVRVDLEWSEEFDVEVGMLQGSVLSLSIAVEDVVTELARG